MNIGLFLRSPDSISFRYLQAYCRESGIQATFLDDLQELGNDHDAYGIACYKNTQQQVTQFLEMTRKLNLPAILGGPVTSIPGDIGDLIRQDIFDINPEAIILYGIGTAGQALPTLLKNLDNLSNVPQIIYKDGNIHKNKIVPKRQRLTLDQSIDLIGSSDGPMTRANGLINGDYSYYFMGSGCTHGKCTFCTTGLYQYNDQIGSDKLLYILNQPGDRRTIELLCDDIMIIRSQLEEIADSINPDPDLSILCKVTTHDILTYPDLFVALGDHCNIILQWGAENINPRILKEMDKGSTSQQIEYVPYVLEDINKYCRYDVKAHLYNIDLWPGVTMEEMRAQTEFLDFMWHKGIYKARTGKLLASAVFNAGAKMFERYYNGRRPVPWTVNWEIEDSQVRQIADASKGLHRELLKTLDTKDSMRIKIDYMRDVFFQ